MGMANSVSPGMQKKQLLGELAVHHCLLGVSLILGSLYVFCL
jgi:hypothetical protein